MSRLFPAYILAVFCILCGVNAQVRWIPASNGHVPFGAFVVGHKGGHQLFLCRDMENGDLIAGRLDTREQGCVVGYNGTEWKNPNYDAAVGDRHIWTAMGASSAIPIRAVMVGMTKNREPTYACRVSLDGDLLPGKVIINACFVAANNREYRFTSYSILVDV